MYKSHSAHSTQFIWLYKHSQASEVVKIILIFLKDLSLRPFLCNFHHRMFQRIFIFTCKLLFAPLKMRQILLTWKQIENVYVFCLMEGCFVQLFKNSQLLKGVFYFFYELGLNKVAGPIFRPSLEIFLRCGGKSW